MLGVYRIDEFYWDKTQGKEADLSRGSRVFPRSALLGAQVGQARLAWERSSAAGGGDRVRDYGLSGEGETPHPVRSADSTSPSGRGGSAE